MKMNVRSPKDSSTSLNPYFKSDLLKQNIEQLIRSQKEFVGSARATQPLVSRD